jgi:hypothetical protein
MIQGKTFFKIFENDDKIEFYSTEGELYIMEHQQDCCESVSIDDINGDLNDLIGTPILKYEEVVSDGSGDDYESSTWTFYHFSTIKGYVTIKWFGVSNGYYSESVDFYKSDKNYLDEWRDYKLSNLLN